MIQSNALQELLPDVGVGGAVPEHLLDLVPMYRLVTICLPLITYDSC